MYLISLRVIIWSEISWSLYGTCCFFRSLSSIKKTYNSSKFSKTFTYGSETSIMVRWLVQYWWV